MPGGRFATKAPLARQFKTLGLRLGLGSVFLSKLLTLGSLFDLIFNKMLNQILNGDCLELLPQIDAEVIDLILTDPPYGIKFMGKSWDGEVPGIPYWEEMLRVAKPGAYLLAFGGTRTSHQLATVIESAGWQIRDVISYLHDDSPEFAAFWESLSPEQQQAYLELHYPAPMLQWVYSSGMPKGLNIGKAIDKKLGKERKIVGRYESPENTTGMKSKKQTVNTWGKGDYNSLEEGSGVGFITEPATKLAAKWEGWNTNLKPAWEPIIMARKPPYKGSILEGILTYGTGALNVEKCKTASDRYPANVIHDGTQLVLDLFPETDSGGSKGFRKFKNGYLSSTTPTQFDDKLPRSSRSAARFFYCAKASPKERGEGNNHPTVKPLKLLEYLVNLASKEFALVLDPFAGSGTTGVACRNLNRNFIGINKNADYCKIAESRLSHLASNSKFANIV